MQRHKSGRVAIWRQAVFRALYLVVFFFLLLAVVLLHTTAAFIRVWVFCSVCRCNVSGSIRFKKLVLNGDYQTAMDVAKKQVMPLIPPAIGAVGVVFGKPAPVFVTVFFRIYHGGLIF